MELLSSVMGLAVFVMACAQLKLVIQNETSVETSDNGEAPSLFSPGATDIQLTFRMRRPDWYRKVAKSQNKKYKNPYDLGWKENLKDFFNVGPGPDR